MVLSSDTEMTALPSRLKAKLFTAPLCPSNFIFSDPVLASHNLPHQNKQRIEVMHHSTFMRKMVEVEEEKISPNGFVLRA